MNKKIILLLALVISIAVMLSACSLGNQKTSSAQEPQDKLTVLGAEYISGLDINSYDLNLTCLKINGSTLSVSDIGYDGDERELHSVTQYNLADDVVFLSKDVSKVIYTSNNKSETKITYSLLKRSDLEKMLNEDNSPASSYIWLDSDGNCKYLMVYGGTTHWE